MAPVAVDVGTCIKLLFVMRLREDYPDDFVDEGGDDMGTKEVSKRSMSMHGAVGSHSLQPSIIQSSDNLPAGRNGVRLANNTTRQIRN